MNYMQTEEKKSTMTTNIAEIAQEFEIRPGQVFTVLAELGLDHDGTSFEADADTVELVKGGCLEQLESKVITLKPNSTPRDVAFALGVPAQEMQKNLISKFRIMKAVANPLTEEETKKITDFYEFELAFADAPTPKAKVVNKGGAKPGGAVKRPPVVTIMGHVDHGKTSLLDYIRKANVADKEFGGITQHIGAYQVALPEGLITFLDTPGHAAFTSMRARGAQVTDIAILVVAADDGIMPQTIEAIQHIQAANCPMIVAVNKCDKPGANPDRVLQQLTEYNVIAEAFGGQTITANVSALTGSGVPELLELIILQSDIMELKADPKAPFKGVVIEAKMEKGRGPVATVLVQDGTLKIGDAVAVGSTFGRLKAMTDYNSERINEAGPSVPVEILGLNEVPGAGDVVDFHADERSARIVAEEREEIEHKKSLAKSRGGLSLRGLRERMTDDGIRQLNLIVKADVQGSVEAVKGMLEKVKNAEVEAKIILSGVGSINKADVDLAAASESICVGFNVKPEPEAKREAEKRKVEIRTYNIIYELIEDIEAAVKGMLAPKFEEQYLGTAEVRVRLQFSKKGIIAGSYLTDGKITRNAKVRVKRGKELVHEGDVSTLKHFKDDVKEVTLGMECGITFSNWEDFQEGDIVEAYEMIQVND
jgi:translation initiation factor IF-2